MFIPYRVDVAIHRWPVSNFAVIGASWAAYMLAYAGSGVPRGLIEGLALQRGSLTGLLTHMWLHAGIIHLVGNMLFLALFGNAICAKVGNLAYPFIYVGLGVLAGLIHLAASSVPAVGASGAINGIVGMFLVLYPLNPVSCVYLYYVRGGTFTVSSSLVILTWFAFDLLGMLMGAPGVAYAAHIGGFLGGVALALALLRTGVLRPDEYERTLVDILRGTRSRPSYFERRHGRKGARPR